MTFFLHRPFLGTWPRDSGTTKWEQVQRRVTTEQTGVGEVRFVDDGQPVPEVHIYTPAGKLRWTQESPKRAGFYYVRLVGTADYDAIKIDPSFTYDSTLEFCGPLPLPPEDQ